MAAVRKAAWDQAVRWLIAVVLLAVALLSLLWPEKRSETALRTTHRVSSVPDRSRLGAEGTTTEPLRPVTTRASRSRITPPRARTAPKPAVQAGDLIDRLAMCESGMNPRTNTGNGFYGAFQFMLSTWRKFRPGNPIDYSYAEQKAVIQQYFPVSSWRSQFPACARRLGVA